jgi:phosphoglycolate phosphatase
MTQNHFEAELLIFDLDGTLVDTRRDLANAVNHVLRHLGKDELDLETITSYVGDGVRKLLERVLGNTTAEEVEKARQYFRQFYAEHLADFSQLYPGIREVLDYFSKKKKAVISNKPQEFTEALLQRLDIHDYFEMIIGGKPEIKLKPDPEAIQMILQTLKIPPIRSIIIGDGENDILAGKAAGIATCAVTHGFRPEEKLLALQPDFVIHDPPELISLVKSNLRKGISKNSK